jgi:shikimate kinase
MSGTGKSYWSKKLESQGFKRFGCDDLITVLLAMKFGIAEPEEFDMHQWVGYPDEETHVVRAQQYLDTEKDVLNEIIDYLNEAGEHENIVIDSTGSVIYMQEEILDKLRKLTSIVYLDITPDDFNRMLQYYLENPVAIIWNNYFLPNPAESRSQTFSRCYPQLINSREQKYKELAHLTIPPDLHRASDTTVEKFLNIISRA